MAVSNNISNHTVECALREAIRWSLSPMHITSVYLLDELRSSYQLAKSESKADSVSPCVIPYDAINCFEDPAGRETDGDQ